MSRKEGECALLVMWVSCQQLTQLVSLQISGVSRCFVPERDSLCVKDAVCSLGGRARVDQIRSASTAGGGCPPPSRASQGRSSSSCHCFLDARVPAVCLSAGCASPPSPISAPNPSRRGRFGLLRPAVVGIGGAQGGRSTLEGEVQSLESPFLLAVRLPLQWPLDLTSIEFCCNATSANCPMRMRTADLSIAPFGGYNSRRLRHEDASLSPSIEVYPVLAHSVWHVHPWWGGRWTVVDLKCGVPEGIWSLVWGRSRSPRGLPFVVIRDMIHRPPLPPTVCTYGSLVHLLLDVKPFRPERPDEIGPALLTQRLLSLDASLSFI